MRALRRKTHREYKTVSASVSVLAYLSHAGGLKATNAGVWGRAPGKLALPERCFTYQKQRKLRNKYDRD